MSETNVAASPRLVIRRIFNAPRARVFAAWTQPELLKQWFGPPGYSVPDAQVDVVTGGSYRITMRAADGANLIVAGVFRQVRAPEHLSYTWQWEAPPPMSDQLTIVTVDFHERDGGTEIVLTHEGFATEESRAGHEAGWNGALDNLVTIF